MHHVKGHVRGVHQGSPRDWIVASPKALAPASRAEGRTRELSQVKVHLRENHLIRPHTNNEKQSWLRFQHYKLPCDDGGVQGENVRKHVRRLSEQKWGWGAHAKTTRTHPDRLGLDGPGWAWLGRCPWAPWAYGHMGALAVIRTT